MALNLAKYRELISVDKLVQLKEANQEVLLHYGRLKAMRDKSDEVFGEFGERAGDMFGAQEAAFLRKLALPRFLDPAALGLKVSQSLLTCLRGIRIGHKSRGTPTMIYLGNVAGCGAGKSRLGASVVDPMTHAAKTIWGDLTAAAGNQKSERGGDKVSGGQAAKMVFPSFTDKGCAKALERNVIKSPEFNIDEGEQFNAEVGLANKPDKVGAREIEAQGTLSSMWSEAKYGKLLKEEKDCYDLPLASPQLYNNWHVDEMIQILGGTGQRCHRAVGPFRSLRLPHHDNWSVTQVLGSSWHASPTLAHYDGTA